MLGWLTRWRRKVFGLTRRERAFLKAQALSYALLPMRMHSKEGAPRTMAEWLDTMPKK
jgi:hypothetical protein